MRRSILLAVTMLSANLAFAGRDTVSVFFPLNQYVLTEEYKSRLDDAIFKGILTDAQPISIIGYTDELGTDSYNLHLSRQRTESVKAYLIQSGFREAQIMLLVGKGEQGAMPTQSPDGRLEDRRVDVMKARVASVTKRRQNVFRLTPEATLGNKMRSAVDLSSVQDGQTLVLDKIYFYPGRHVVRSESSETLQALYEALSEHPEIKIRIEGHVCCVSPGVSDALDEDTHNIELSVTRAKAIQDYLISRGIAKARLQYAGFGHRRPVVMPETSEEVANRNRRVEIRIIK